MIPAGMTFEKEILFINRNYAVGFPLALPPIFDPAGFNFRGEGISALS
jgi:hypothetical protein